MSSQVQHIQALIEPTITALGYELIRVSIMSSPRGLASTLQIMAERPDGSMLVEDCEKISREVAVIMDVEDPISDEYVLEVSSPGVDRPLTRPKDFVKYAGYVIKIETSIPVDGRRRFQGPLMGMDGDLVKIKVDGTEFELDYGNIHKAKLVLTDELLAAVTRQ